jgi:N-acetylmuramoyl-L-alanine amidase
LACADARLVGATEGPLPPAATSSFPTASDARLAGDAKQTRFILDLDQ